GFADLERIVVELRHELRDQSLQASASLLAGPDDLVIQEPDVLRQLHRLLVAALVEGLMGGALLLVALPALRGFSREERRIVVFRSGPAEEQAQRDDPLDHDDLRVSLRRISTDGLHASG